MCACHVPSHTFFIFFIFSFLSFFFFFYSHHPLPPIFSILFNFLTTSSTCEAIFRALDPEATQEVPGLWRKRDLSETVLFRLRIGHRLHQQGRRVGPCFGHPPIQDNAVPFGAVPFSGLLHTRSRFEAWSHLFGSADTRASCPLQVELLGKEATHPPPPRASWCRTG